jgi:hypothetical protein
MNRIETSAEKPYAHRDRRPRTLRAIEIEVVAKACRFAMPAPPAIEANRNT